MSEPMLQDGPLPSPPRVRTCGIDSVASALPDQIVTNADLARRLGVDEHWITKRTGVRERRAVREGEGLLDLAARAGQLAIERAGIEPTTIDLVIVATFTPDDPLPHVAQLVAVEVGAERAGAMDLAAACAGFVSGVAVGAAMVESGRADRVLVVAGEILTRAIDPDDRRTAPLFGDGAGAAVLSAEGDGRIGPSVLRSEGRFGHLVRQLRSDMVLRMEGQEVYPYAVRTLAEVTEEVLERASWTLDDVDLFVYHQANARILGGVCGRLGLSEERAVNYIGETGNTSAASIPLALDQALREGRLRPGMRVLLAAIGGSYVWGAVVLEWGASGVPGGT